LSNKSEGFVQLGDEVGYSNSEQNTMLFDEQRMNVAYFLNDLRGDSLTKEGKRRLSELGVTESEAIELTKEREISIKSTSQNEAGSANLDTETVRAVVEVLEKIAEGKDIDRILEILHSEKSKEPYLVHEKPQ
jgi:hypothetical protein